MTVMTFAGSRLARVTRAVAVAVLGFFLMFVGHFLAFVGWSATHDLALQLPYWWGFVLIYPMVGLVLARRRVLFGWRVACPLYAAPFLYVFLRGATEGRWSVSRRAPDACLHSAPQFVPPLRHVTYVVTRVAARS